MATYDSIKFDIDMARVVILDECDKVMRSAIEKHMDSLEYQGYIGGSSTDGTVSWDYTVWFMDIRSWVMFFGMGKAIDWKNPYLDEYMRSDFWANGRSKSGALVRRGEGTYSQYDYKTGELKDYEGTEPQGEELPSGLQAARTQKPSVDFWKTIEEIYNSFLEGFRNTALPNIERRFVTECFAIEQHKT